MSPSTPSDPGASADHSDLETPIAELSGLTVPLDTGFAARVVRRLERRLLTGELLGLAWTGPFLVLLELIRAPFEFLLTGRRD